MDDRYPLYRASAPVPPDGRVAMTALTRAVAGLETSVAGTDGPLTEAEVLALTGLARRMTALAATVDLAGGASGAVHDLPAAVEGLRRATDALGARALSAVQADQTWSFDGHRTFRSWLVGTTGISRARASREIRRATALRDHLPTFARYLAEGVVGADHVDVVVKHALGTEDRVAALEHQEFGEPALAGAAADAGVGEFTRTVRLWADRMDPEAAERAWRESLDSEHLALAQTMGGWHLQGFLGDEHGQMLRLALDAHTGQPGAEDDRTVAQRDADALVGLARQALDSGALQRGARIRPHLIALVPLDTWTRTAAASALAGRVARDAAAGAMGADEEPEAVLTAALDLEVLRGTVPATFEDGTPLAPGQLARHLCDAAVTRVVMDADSEVIDVGREQRLFTEPQAKGIIARDRHCQFPGCDAKPNWCQFHHTIWWSRDGKSNIGDGILLCWAHHTMVHALELSILKFPDRWEYRTRHGELHGVRPRGRHPTLPIALPRRRG